MERCNESDSAQWQSIYGTRRYSSYPEAFPIYSSEFITTNPFLVETGPTPGPDTQQFLPSGIAVIGIDSWVERFARIYVNTPT